MKGIFLILFYLVAMSCASQKTSLLKNDSIYCDERISINYRTSKYLQGEEELVKDVGSPSIFVMMDGGFSDTLEVYFNDKLKARTFFLTDDVLGTTQTGVEYDYSIDVSPPILRINSITNNYCLELQIDSRYRILYLHRSKDGWAGTYSNFYHNYE